MRKRITHMYRESKQPFDALWNWAKGHYKRWRALTKFAKARGISARDRKGEGLKQLAGARKDLDKLRGEIAEKHEQLANKQKDFKDAKTEARRRELHQQMNLLEGQIKRLTGRIDTNVRDVNAAERQIADAKTHIKFWAKKRTAYRKQYKKARKHHQETGEVKYESWMLGWCPGGLSADMEEVVAILVVVWHQTITATSNGGHATGSYHYYDPCRAVDSAGANMSSVMNDLVERYGVGGFREQFGPNPWYVKNGVRYSGQFPGHTDHNHTARAF